MKRLEELFNEAIELAPDERRKMVERIRLEDSDLADRLEALLAQDEDQTNIASAIQGAVEEIAPASATGSRIGPYTVGRLLGQGGMGVGEEQLAGAVREGKPPDEVQRVLAQHLAGPADRILGHGIEVRVRVRSRRHRVVIPE